MKSRYTFLIVSLCWLLGGCEFQKVKPPGEDGCFPASCTEIGASCGLVSDGCGGLMECGDCAVGEVCGASGFENVCCEPTTCEIQAATCGEMADGCGGILLCGECAADETCGGGGPNVCGEGECQALSCGGLGLDCGTINDGCGVTLDCGVCSGDDLCGGSGLPNLCGTLLDDLVPTELEEGCFGFPDEDASTTNFASKVLGLDVGDTAVDFTLLDLDGTPHSLSELLETKPVMIQTGSYTCPVFQDNIRDTELLAAQFGEEVHFVVVYTPEAHPLGEPSPYFGTLREARYSIFGTERTYDERVEHAASLELNHDQLLLIDDLSPGELDNPFWCTYATAPNAAFLIERDGTINTAHLWFDAPSMLDAIENLVN